MSLSLSGGAQSLASTISFQGFLIRESLLLDAGIEGYYGMDLFIDEYQNIANEFLEISEDWSISSLTENGGKEKEIRKMGSEEMNRKNMRKVFPRFNNITVNA
eukprot:CAMPEP_0170519552 /NCGR_PEP_ID=MMETSP0209-20121228/4928_1 /TAXON_ID=665100 ORGANISM="Litonotus pictus, Strain P1" /NCGR_SAMPLE_ID=MMETSP0209 /ASSEMBLY_ACC=CAM_ASM_000301 /LENGTH=102 /DNA_ID=CAMNT_0010805467 /DNA_START=860 /DNA_END=1168 /DNA_ORIENTATION=-